LKYLFATLLSILVGASLVTFWLTSERAADKPVIYWVTDNNPARTLQIQNFGEWMRKNNYPDCELRIDSANREPSKLIIQSISGVGGDVMDCGGGDVIYFQEMGIMEDVTEDAKRLGFDPAKTYPSLEDDLKVQGRQYLFPCNVSANMFFVNLGIFKELGLEAPPMRWDIAEFERRGKEFVAVANRGLERRQYFWSADIDILTLMRSFGTDVFNETLTRAQLTGAGHDGYRNALKLNKKWINEDHLVPSAAESASFTSEVGYGGAGFQLFFSGKFAMVPVGRYALIQFREFGKLELDAVEFPNGGYPNTTIATRAAFVYKGGKHKELAKYFLAYLASEEYNMNIVADADALPPNPIYTLREEYLQPKEFPNEWRVHKKFAQDAVAISIVMTKSPFVSNNLVYNNYMKDCRDAVLSNLMSPEDAVKLCEQRINEEIARKLKENPKLRPEYNRQLAIQKKIDGLRKAGKKVPLELISNPFHKKYYKDMGWLEAE